MEGRPELVFLGEGGGLDPSPLPSEPPPPAVVRRRAATPHTNHPPTKS